MRRIVLQFVLATFTFTGGVAINKIVTTERHTVSSHQIREFKPVAPLVVEVPRPQSIPTPAPNLILDYEPERFDPRGDYFIIGGKPKEFREFDCLELGTDESDGRPLGDVMVQTYSNAQYGVQALVFSLVTEERLYFKTASHSEEGFEYTFDGEFLRSGVISEAAPGKAVLKGKLTKLKQRRKIAECQVKFRVEYLGC